MTVRVVRDRLIVLTCQDNLVRGAAGVAVQNFNRMYGYDETTALICRRGAQEIFSLDMMEPVAILPRFPGIDPFA